MVCPAMAVWELRLPLSLAREVVKMAKEVWRVDEHVEVARAWTTVGRSHHSEVRSGEVASRAGRRGVAGRRRGLE